MSVVPAPFQSVFKQWEQQRGLVSEVGWTTALQRHFKARVDVDGKRYFAKLALAKQGDLDEQDMLEGMRREVWWSNVIQKLREDDPSFPFHSPSIWATNVNQQPFRDEVAWVAFEHIEGQPVVDWEPERSDRTMTSTEVERFDQLFDVVIRSLRALEKIHPHTLERLGLPPLPSPPHGMRRWQKKGLLDMQTAVLGNGAFEIKNFWRTSDGRFVLMDNEFAGWYPKYDHLSYLYHRLYCNTMRPDLAKRMLDRYMQEAMRTGDFNASPDSLLGFWTRFTRILKPRLLGGWYYDTVRRKLMPWHKKQRLRYELLWSMLRGHYGKLAH